MSRNLKYLGVELILYFHCDDFDARFYLNSWLPTNLTFDLRITLRSGLSEPILAKSEAGVSDGL
jgi:hypothetical protein